MNFIDFTKVMKNCPHVRGPDNTGHYVCTECWAVSTKKGELLKECPKSRNS